VNGALTSRYALFVGENVLGPPIVPEIVPRLEGLIVVLDGTLEFRVGLVGVVEHPVQDRVGRLRLLLVQMFGNGLDEPAAGERTKTP
jgi:hypothetical protein